LRQFREPGTGQGGLGVEQLKVGALHFQKGGPAGPVSVVRQPGQLGPFLNGGAV
jgi:hypothetical protein